MTIPILPTRAIEFTERECHNAIGFLGRVPLKGNEARALVNLIERFTPRPAASETHQETQSGTV